jgi:Flp pilus assembly protein TadD
MLEQAGMHLARREFDRVEGLARDVISHSDLPGTVAHALLGEALVGQGKPEEALAVYREGLERSPKDVDLTARCAITLARNGRAREALPIFEKVKKARERDPVFLTQFAQALAEAGRLEEAERLAVRAAASGSLEGKFSLGFVRLRAGRYEDAQKLLIEVEQNARREELVGAAKGLRADAKLLAGDAAEALSLWKVVRAAGRLFPAHLAHMAYAAQICGDSALCDELIAAPREGKPTAEDRLLYAQIANLRGKPAEALEHLAASEQAGGERFLAHDFEVAATRGRALRLLGRDAEAKQVLSALQARPESDSARLGPQVRVDLGHLELRAGDGAAARRHFEAALALDAQDPEARQALAALAGGPADQAEASRRAELEGMRRRFVGREVEVHQLKAELERLAEQKRAAEQKAREAEARARQAAQDARAAEAGAGRKVRDELEQREADVDEKARESLQRALGAAKDALPPALFDALRVAERTFQTSLYVDLPAAAVAVLYTGALERGLYALFVERFRHWLDGAGRRQAFLEGAVRERRGVRVEYFDHFVEAFDLERPGRAPSMGEVGRILDRRHEPYLSPFLEFLHTTYAAPDAFYDALAAFVAWSKEGIRDPVAHGRMDDVGYEQLKSFRQQFLFDLGGRGRGALALLLCP